MGWLAVLVMDDMQRFLSKPALTFLIIGGLSYTIGALFYALKKVRYTHAIWHIFCTDSCRVSISCPSIFYVI